MPICFGLVKQLDGQSYAHTKFSTALAAEFGTGKYFQLAYDDSFMTINNFHEYLEQKGYKEPEDQRYNPYTWKVGLEGMTIWDAMAMTNPERLKAFHANIAHSSIHFPLTGFYDFSKLATTDGRISLVDVGGGSGHSIKRILQAHPDIEPESVVLQDRSEAIEQSKGILPPGVRAMEHNFFTQQPIKGRMNIPDQGPALTRWMLGAKAYLLRMILHDYSDATAIKILKQIVPAMERDSVVLIADYILPERVTDKELRIVSVKYHTLYATPLLTSSQVDIIMLTLGGKERTEEALKALFRAVRLEHVKTTRPQAGFGAITEARLLRN
jgi:hypothetical protein